MQWTNQSVIQTMAIAVIMPLLVPFSQSVAGPGTLNRDEIPDKYKWDLSDIYPDWESWEEDLDKLETMMDDYAALKGTLAEGPEQLLKAYLLGDQLGMIAYKVYQYPGLTRATDTRNNEVSARLQRVQALFAKFNVATAWFDPELLTIPWDTMKDWLDKTKELAPYRYGIENLYRQQEHVLDEDKEQLLSYFSRFNGTPGSIYSELSTSDIKFNDVTLSTGETVTLTPGKYDNILSTDRDYLCRRVIQFF